MLREAGITARIVEGRMARRRTTLIQWLLYLTGLTLFNVHFWVEAFVDGEWLTLDPSPDSGITQCMGDTKPGSHLGDFKYIARFEEIPQWYRDTYHVKLFSPFQTIGNIELAIRRKIQKCRHSK